MLLAIFQDLAQILLDYAIEAGIAVLGFLAGLLTKRPKKTK